MGNPPATFLMDGESPGYLGCHGCLGNLQSWKKSPMQKSVTSTTSLAALAKMKGQILLTAPQLLRYANSS
jgi:hypothetical protein